MAGTCSGLPALMPGGEISMPIDDIPAPDQGANEPLQGARAFGAGA